MSRDFNSDASIVPGRAELIHAAATLDAEVRALRTELARVCGDRDHYRQEHETLRRILDASMVPL